MLEHIPVLHAIVTNEGEAYGFSITSPQLPAFVGIYQDEKTLRRNYRDDLEQAAKEAGISAAQVVGHMQVRGVTTGGQEYLVRWSTVESDIEERLEAGRMATRMLETEEGLEFVREVESDAAGVITVIACMPSDTLGWVVEQMDPRNDLAAIVADVGHQLMYATAVATGADRPGWQSFKDQGITFDMTINDLMLMGDRMPDRIAVGA